MAHNPMAHNEKSLAARASRSCDRCKARKVRCIGVPPHPVYKLIGTLKLSTFSASYFDYLRGLCSKSGDLQIPAAGSSG